MTEPGKGVPWRAVTAIPPPADKVAGAGVHRAAVAVALALAFGVVSPVFAEEQPPAPQVVEIQQPGRLAPPLPAPRTIERGRWYGWQTLIVDGGALALGIVGGILNSNSDGPTGTESGFTPADTLIAAGVGTYLFGPPGVHFTHGNVSAGFRSFGIRLGAPPVLGLVGIFAGTALDGPSSGDSVSGGVVIGAGAGLLAGYLFAVATDAAVFAREPVLVDPPHAPPRAHARLELAPTFVLGGTRAAVGLMGRF